MLPGPVGNPVGNAQDHRNGTLTRTSAEFTAGCIIQGGLMRHIVFTAFVLLWIGASSFATASDDATIAALQAETEALFSRVADVKLSIDRMVDPAVTLRPD